MSIEVLHSRGTSEFDDLESAFLFATGCTDPFSIFINGHTLLFTCAMTDRGVWRSEFYNYVTGTIQVYHPCKHHTPSSIHIPDFLKALGGPA